ncbi:hypothetical protein EU642_22250 [Salmonella enterica]|nr:hypothetical protein [Salmonella enterica]EAO0118577.1 hypothetical protein [Salmonella enterica]EAO3601680.1 hypothetical protein [Salmonella enterica]EAR6391575.1 hypothetical protein [Salmonella enterica]EAV1285339.1 hypothetical protein [Salmonella enterica]
MGNNVPVHNPPSCTCQRMIWLGDHCDSFEIMINVSGIIVQARIGNERVLFSGQYRDTAKHVAEAFKAMWKVWQPASGVKMGEA